MNYIFHIFDRPNPCFTLLKDNFVDITHLFDVITSHCKMVIGIPVESEQYPNVIFIFKILKKLIKINFVDFKLT